MPRRIPVVPLFWLLMALLFGVFLFAPVTVTLDGYSLLYGAHTLRQMFHGQPEIQQYFSYNSFLIPNWLSTLTLAGFASVMPDELALKLLLVLSMTMLLASLFFCVDTREYNSRQRAQVLIVLLPFAINGYLTLGFFGFFISTSICLFIIGMLLRHGLEIESKVPIVLLLLIAYFFHPLPVLVTFVFVASHVLSAVLVRGSLNWRDSRYLLQAWPWAVPAALILWFYVRLSSVSQNRHSFIETLKNRAILLSAPKGLSLVSPSPTSAAVFIALLGILGASLFIFTKRASTQEQLRSLTLVIFSLCTFILYFVLPEKIGDGSNIADRTLQFVIFGLVLLSVRRGALDQRLLTVCSILAAFCVTAFAAEYMIVSRRLSPGLTELRTATKDVPPLSRVLVLSYLLTPSCEVWPLFDRSLPQRHWALSVATAKNLVVLNDYEASTSHFPLRYRDSRFTSIIDELDLEGSKNMDAWNEVLGRRDKDVDYILSWGVPSGVSSCPAPVAPPLEDRLGVGYDRIVSNQGTSRVGVWRIRK